ncbi:conserved protein of unknown function [Georgfuchsia toluolica]|uniref:Type II secretion system protein GspB C-terminal domain-containing protein n=1 Tax=Georgfuchsia toluolica TaxID=424218 RepID=A0A916N274_9PROT|nr:general secretion pathway protein GspB [Georgfuchsia toluolica]CAG4883524.1 conserved protein of unknown function [Georgfuchsia toluolica]
MSYILDALKKSDQQRRRGVAPTLLAPQLTAAVSERRLSKFHVLLAVLLITAGIVIGALRPWQGEQPASIPASAMVVQAARPPVAMTLPESNPPPSPASVQAQSPLHSEQEIPAQKPATATLPAPVAQPPNPIAVSVPPSAAGKPEVSAAAATTQEQTVMTMAELPLSIQQEIPKMTITVHAYSRTSKERLLGINDRMLREGDYLIPGLMLEQITPEGMIMNYKGYRFRHGVR